MSESSLFASLDEVPADEAGAGGEGRRNLLVLGAVGAAALAGAAYFLLGSGGAGDEQAFTVPTRTRPAAAASASPAPVALPAATNVSLGRNPFKALYVAPAAVSATTVSSGANPPAAPAAPAPAPVQAPPATPPVVIVADPGGGYTPPPAAPSSPAPAPAPAQSTVALKGVQVTDGKPVGTFRYDNQTVTGAPGEVMAGRLMVISLQQDVTGSWFANLQLGDGSPFEVHERQTVVVQ